MGGERLDVLEVTARGRREALELGVDAPEAVGEAEEVRRNDHAEGRARDKDVAGAHHVAQLLVGEVVAELVEDALGREVHLERRAEVGRREVAAYLVLEYLRRVPHDAAGALVALGLRDHAHLSRTSVRSAGGGVRHGRKIGQVGANRDAEPARCIGADDAGEDVAWSVRSRRLGWRAVTLGDEVRRRHAVGNEREGKLEQPRVGKVGRPPLEAVRQRSSVRRVGSVGPLSQVAKNVGRRPHELGHLGRTA